MTYYTYIIFNRFVTPMLEMPAFKTLLSAPARELTSTRRDELCWKFLLSTTAELARIHFEQAEARATQTVLDVACAERAGVAEGGPPGPEREQ
jgi:hypothetical protein